MSTFCTAAFFRLKKKLLRTYQFVYANELLMIGELSKLDKQTGVKFDFKKGPIERKPIYR